MASLFSFLRIRDPVAQATPPTCDVGEVGEVAEAKQQLELPERFFGRSTCYRTNCSEPMGGQGSWKPGHCRFHKTGANSLSRLQGRWICCEKKIFYTGCAEAGLHYRPRLGDPLLACKRCSTRFYQEENLLLPYLCSFHPGPVERKGATGTNYYHCCERQELEKNVRVPPCRVGRHVSPLDVKEAEKLFRESLQVRLPPSVIIDLVGSFLYANNNSSLSLFPSLPATTLLPPTVFSPTFPEQKCSRANCPFSFDSKTSVPSPVAAEATEGLLNPCEYHTGFFKQVLGNWSCCNTRNTGCHIASSHFRAIQGEIPHECVRCGCLAFYPRENDLLPNLCRFHVGPIEKLQDGRRRFHCCGAEEQFFGDGVTRIANCAAGPHISKSLWDFALSQVVLPSMTGKHPCVQIIRSYLSVTDLFVDEWTEKGLPGAWITSSF